MSDLQTRLQAAADAAARGRRSSVAGSGADG
jgi:hypothetical protein